MNSLSNAINWFEIPVRDIERAQAFYEKVLGKSLRREAMGSCEMAVIPYDQPGVGGALSTHAENALSKILSVLPSSTRAAAESLAVYAPSYPLHEPMRIQLEAVRLATESHRKLRLLYRDLRDAESRRTVRPLGCFYWGKVWTLGAWCERRGDFRNFRVDRIVELEVLEERFSDEPGRTLADLFRAVEHETCEDVAQPGLSRS